MSDHVVQSYHDGNGKAVQSVRSYQSVWMAHWTQTSCNVAPLLPDRISLPLEYNNDCDSGKHHLLSGIEVASDSPSAKGFTEITEARTVRIMNEPLTSTQNMVRERLDCQPFPMFRLCQNISSELDPKNDPDTPYKGRTSRPQIDCNIECNAPATMSHFPPVLSVALPSAETTSRECQFEGVSLHHEEPVHFRKVVGGGSLALTGPSQDKFIGSTQIVPYRMERGKAPVSSSFTSICEKKLDNQSLQAKSGISVLRQSLAFQSLQDPFAGNNHLPILVGERCQKMQKCSVNEFFPSCSSPLEAKKSEGFFNESYSLQKMPVPVHDAETMRISATNPMEGLAGAGVFSQKTHNLLFIKKTDVNLSIENQTFRESEVSAKLKRNMFGELLSLSPPLGKNQQKLKLQHLSTSTESEGKNNAEGVGTSEVRLKNESSAETDTMDMDAFKEQNYLAGVNSSPSNKDILVGQNPPSQPKVASAGEEVGCRRPTTGLPDINEEIPVLPAAGTSMDNAEPSTSRTQSLDAEHLLSHAEQPSGTKSSRNPDGPPPLEPGSRWLKRLKLSASDSSSLGTKISNLGEPSSHEKVNKLFNKIMKGSKSSSSEPMSHKHHGKEEIPKDQAAIVLRNGESSSVESAKKGRDILLSHPWIQRWCHNRAHQKKPEVVVVCEPQSTKMEFHEIQNKQFPSIAAMALMGKAMTGFQQCEVQRKGSFVVWNNKSF